MFSRLLRVLAGNLGLTSAADAIDIEREPVFAKTLDVQIADSLTDLRRFHLRHLAANGAYLVAVAIVVVASLILGLPLEAVADNKTQLHKQSQRVVECSPADGEILLIVEFAAEFLQREMPVDAVDGIENGKPLWSLAVVVQFQVVGQYVPDRRFCAISHLVWLNGVKNRTKLLIFPETSATII